jgi:hypothetical protein
MPHALGLCLLPSPIFLYSAPLVPPNSAPVERSRVFLRLACWLGLGFHNVVHYPSLA